MLISREVQLEILNEAAKKYPNPVGNLSQTLTASPQSINANAFYLEEHGLVQLGHVSLHGHKVIHSIRITAAGIDFLSEDGGLAKALAVVTVRLHEESIRQIFEQKLESAAMPDEEKSKLKTALRELSGESLKHVFTKFIDLGFDNAPKAFELIQRAASIVL